MDKHKLNSERRTPISRYEINDLKDRCREKLLGFFIRLEREMNSKIF